MRSRNCIVLFCRISNEHFILGFMIFISYISYKSNQRSMHKMKLSTGHVCTNTQANLETLRKTHNIKLNAFEQFETYTQHA